MLKYDHFTRMGYIIQNITIYDKPFEEFSNSKIKFAINNPSMVVEIYTTVPEFVDTVSSTEDFNIYASFDMTDNKKIAEFMNVRENREALYSVITVMLRNEERNFLIDISNLEVLGEGSFELELPVRGINTLFIFEDDESKQVYSLFNPMKSVDDTKIYSWFLGYLTSQKYALKPIEKVTPFAKELIQALAIKFFDGRAKKKPNILMTPEINAAKMSNNGKNTVKYPGRTNRFAFLKDKKDKKYPRRSKVNG